jgi:hypothetical protein
MDMSVIAILIIILSILVSLVVFIITQYGWSCKGETCKKIFGGEYRSKDDCQSGCSKKASLRDEVTNLNKSVRFEDEKRYACTNKGQCVESSQGDYVDLGSCDSNCNTYNNAYNYQVIPYYPQSLYGLDWHGERRWGGGGRHGGHKRHRKR